MPVYGAGGGGGGGSTGGDEPGGDGDGCLFCWTIDNDIPVRF